MEGVETLMALIRHDDVCWSGFLIYDLVYPEVELSLHSMPAGTD